MAELNPEQWAEVERLFKCAAELQPKAWELRKSLLGPEDPATLADEAALAGVLDGTDRYDESEPMYHHVLSEFEKIYGPSHYEIDRKSTRLNSSHLVISYAVF